MAKDDDNSFFSKFAIGAPIGIGLGVGARNLFRNHKSSTVFSKPVHDTSFLNNFVSGLSGESLNIRPEEVTSAIAGRDFKSVQSAWNLAFQSSDPAGVLRKPTLDPDSARNAIEYFAQQNTSFQGNKTLKNFLGQLKSLDRHNQSGMVGGIPTTIPPGFSNLSKKSFSRHSVSLESINNSELKNSLSAIQESILSLSPQSSFDMRMASREGVTGSQLMIGISGGKFGSGTTLEIPMEIPGQPGVIAHGVTQQTKRIVGQYGVTDGNRIVSTLKHEEWVARRFQEKIIPQLSSNSRLSARRIKEIVNEFNRSTIEHSQVIPNLPIGEVPAIDVAARMGGHRRMLVDKSFDPLDAAGVSSIVSNLDNGVFPSTSGNQMSKGIVSTIDAQKLWLGGQSFPWERRPMQAFGRGYGPTIGANAARAKNPLYEKYSWLYNSEHEKLFGNTNLDFLARTTYFDESKHTSLAEKALGGVPGGQGLRSSLLNSEMSRVEGLDTSLQITNLNSKLVDAMKNNPSGVHKFDGLNFNEGEILGYDKDLFPVHYKPGMNITGALEYTSKDTGFVKLTGNKKVDSEKAIKVFGAAKAMLIETSHSELNNLIKRETGLNINTEIAVGMDELRKNRTLHNIQMLTALHDFTYEQMRAAKTGSFKDAHANMFGDVLRDVLDTSDNNQVLSKVYGAARTNKLQPAQMGKLFGAIPAVYGKEWSSELEKIGVSFSGEERSWISKGAATGIMPFVYGGPGSGGGMGSVEPRIFDILNAQHYGVNGQKVASALGERMIMAYPDIAAEQSTLKTALSSIKNGVKDMEGISKYHIKDIGDKEISDILEKGGIVNTAGVVEGLNNIYIPGSNKSRSMRGWQTPDGRESTSRLSHTYEDFLDTGRQVYHGGLSRRAVADSIDALTAELGTAYVGTITGKGTGLARNKIPGSKYLRLLAGTEEQLGGLNIKGISRNSGLDMLNQMESLYSRDQNEMKHIQSMRERFLSGDVIGDISSRDPDIGPYSVSLGGVRMMSNLDDGHMMVAQKTKVIADASGNELARVALGPMAGWAADVDGDHAHIMLASSKIEKDVLNHYSVNSPALRQYEDYAIRQQLLKAKAPKSAGLSASQEAGFAAEKLIMAKQEIGKLSVPLSQLTRSLNENTSLTADRLLNARSVSEALENQVISLKHVSGEQLGTISQQMEKLIGAAHAGRGKEMGKIMQDVFAHNQIAQELLMGDNEVFIDGKPRMIKGVNLAQAAEDISTSVSKYRQVNNGQSTAVLDKELRGQIKLNRSNIDRLLNYEGGNLAQFKLGSTQNIGSKLSRNLMAVKNQMGALGSEIIEHAGKPLAMGFGASLAISALLSKPLSNLTAGDSAPIMSSGRINTSNTSSIPPENVHPDSEVQGEPSIPSVFNGPSARMNSGESRNAHVFIRGMNRNGANINTVSTLISRRLGQNSNNIINVRDKRTSLSQQRIDSIIRR